MSVVEQAASSNHIELVRLLLAKGAAVNTADGGGFTPLLAAASSGDRNAPLVKLLLDHGAAVNVKSGDTFEMVKSGPIQLGHLTPLQMVAAQRTLRRSRRWSKAGANVNAKDVRSQQEDGTWHVATRALGFQPYFESGFPHGHDQWISQAGTALAAIALTFAAK
jgi:hypothetical protein